MEKCYSCGSPGAKNQIRLSGTHKGTPIEVLADFCDSCMAEEVKRMMGLRGTRTRTEGTVDKSRVRRVPSRVTASKLIAEPHNPAKWNVRNVRETF